MANLNSAEEQKPEASRSDLQRRPASGSQKVLTSALPGFQPSSLFYSFRFFTAERQVFEKKENLTVSEWAEKYRTVTIGAHTGPWRNDISPYLAKIMDTWQLPHVREVDICKSPMTGGTEVLHCCCAYSASEAPGVMLFVMPSKHDTDKMTNDRIIPMIQKSEKLKDLISPNPDDLAAKRIKLINGTVIYMAWMSRSALASTPVKYLFLDEVDKYPPFVGKETDPITLAEKRTRTFPHTKKIFKISTPTREDGHIWVAFNRASVVYNFFATCPFCKTTQIMKFNQLRYPLSRLNEKDEAVEYTPADILRDSLARYTCEHCEAEWTDTDRDKAVQTGNWQPVKGMDIKRPRSVAFHMPSFLSPDVSLSEIAYSYLISKSDKSKLIDFYNDYLAEPFIEKYSERKEDVILKLKDDRPRGLVPKDHAIILCSIDTQQRGFYYEVRAFGLGQSIESWQVREGYVETFDDIENILYHSEYKDITGNSYPIQAAIMDSGGGTGTVPKHSRTAEVYEFCRKNKIVRPVKGRQTMTRTVSPTQIDYFPRTKKPIPGGITLYNINVTYFKNQLATKLEISGTDPGAWHLHSECTDDYTRHMTAEYKDEKGKWQCPRNRANHYWDIGVYALALAEILQIKFWKEKMIETASKPAGQPEKPKDDKPKGGFIRSGETRTRKKGGWINRS